MGYLSSLYLPGALAMWCALLFSLAALWGYSQVLRGDRGAVRFARRAYTCFALAIVLASVVLGIALVTRDFRIEYVHQYSGMDLPAHYQFAAFWAGQKGSFLIWLLWGALLGLPLLRAAGRRREPTVMTVYTLTLLGLLFILVRESPFVMLNETPTDGQGLNPLLQDDWMVIHPPIMFIGYAAAAIPFSFALSALWRKEGQGWARRAFPWALGGFAVLGLAIFLGGYWAYETLGWGGYWGWDPVENASLIPWIFGAVLIHGLYLERTKNRYRKANYVLAVLVYLAVLYGTFLTRSGVLADFSVHSFVDLGISGWLIALMAVFSVWPLYLFATRLPKIETRPNEDPFVSRGTVVVLGTITLLASALVITFGTSAPLLTGFMENPGQVGPDFYNRVNMPIALLLAILLAAVPFLTWRGSEPKALLRKLVPSAVAAALLTGTAAALAVRDPFHLLYVFLAALALASNLHRAVIKVGNQGLSAAGGYLSHVGVGIALLGFIASSAYDQSTKVTLELDRPVEVGEMDLTFIGFDRADPDHLVIRVDREGETFYSKPKLFRNERTGQTMANPHVRSSMLRDFYVSPLEYSPGRPAGGGQTVELAQGEEARLGELTVRFDGFDLGVDGNAFARMNEGLGQVTLGVQVALEDAAGATGTALPLYRFDQASGRVETPPAQMPGGGRVWVSAIDATGGTVRLAFAGVPGVGGDPGQPATLAVDVTKKPLIQLVWWGMYVLLGGALLSTVKRLRQALGGSARGPGATAETG